MVRLLRLGLFRRRRPQAPRPTWERVAFALHEPEADLMVSLLEELEIPALVRRATIDVPEMLAGGPREVLVPSSRALEAHALLDPLHGDESLDDEPADDDAFEAER